MRTPRLRAWFYLGSHVSSLKVIGFQWCSCATVLFDLWVRELKRYGNSACGPNNLDNLVVSWMIPEISLNLIPDCLDFNTQHTSWPVVTGFIATNHNDVIDRQPPLGTVWSVGAEQIWEKYLEKYGKVTVIISNVNPVTLVDINCYCTSFIGPPNWQHRGWLMRAWHYNFRHTFWDKAWLVHSPFLLVVRVEAELIAQWWNIVSVYKRCSPPPKSLWG